MTKRDKQIHLWVTQEEKDQIEAHALESGINRARYIRIASLKKRLPGQNDPLKKTRAQLIRVGNNLNQLVRIAHGSKSKKIPENAEKVLAEISQTVAKIDEPIDLDQAE